MKKNNIIFKIVLFSLLLNISAPLFSESEKNENDEIPQVMEDIRRFEIITLGSLPFVILDANLAYSSFKYFKNGMNSQDFPSLSPSLTEDEQKGILFTSMGISVGIGLTDLIVNIIKRTRKNKKTETEEQQIHIAPVAENPNAIKLPTLEDLNKVNNESTSDEKTVIEINEEDN